MQTKSELRVSARQKRKALADPDFAAAIAAQAATLAIAPGTIIGGYHALPDEADPALLLDMLAASGCTIAFPRVAAPGMALQFHPVPASEVLKAGPYGIYEPQGHWPCQSPDVLLVPLLAFDATGHRLGYGGGYYDRTIAGLNAVTIGIAYAGQEVSSIPHEPHDRRLDFLLTEQGIRRFS
jgi:5-formyltetrahydrofolate cyclo-ligase